VVHFSTLKFYQIHALFQWARENAALMNKKINVATAPLPPSRQRCGKAAMDNSVV
jgi:hypothetical protein